MICPVCTPHDEITWSDLLADRVQLCDEHRPVKEGELPLPEEL